MQTKNFSVDESLTTDEILEKINKLITEYEKRKNEKAFEQAQKMIADFKKNKKRQLLTTKTDSCLMEKYI